MTHIRCIVVRLTGCFRIVPPARRYIDEPINKLITKFRYVRMVDFGKITRKVAIEFRSMRVDIAISYTIFDATRTQFLLYRSIQKSKMTRSFCTELTNYLSKRYKVLRLPYVMIKVVKKVVP